MRTRPIVALSAGHACVDVYQGMVAALVPFFVAERHYSYAAASGVVLAASLLSSLAQPLFGLLTDRRALPWLLPVSTLLAGVGVALSGVGGSYAATLAAVAVAGLGVAAYHPESARLARQLSGGSPTAMAWFSLGGNLGFAVAPVLVALVVGLGGLRLTPVLILPALVATLSCVPALRQVTGRPGVRNASVTGVDDRRSFARLCVAVVCRSVVFVGLSTFVALFCQQRTGGGAASGATALFLLYAGGAVGTLAGGRLAGRWDRVRVVRGAYLLTSGAVAGLLLVPGAGVFPLVALASAGLYIPFSLQVTLGQDYLPTRIGTASGITLGLTISVGGLVAPLLGLLADATSLRTALACLVVLPVLAWVALRPLAEPVTPAALAASVGLGRRRSRGGVVCRPGGRG